MVLQRGLELHKLVGLIWGSFNACSFCEASNHPIISGETERCFAMEPSTIKRETQHAKQLLANGVATALRIILNATPRGSKHPAFYIWSQILYLSWCLGPESVNIGYLDPLEYLLGHQYEHIMLMIRGTNTHVMSPPFLGFWSADFKPAGRPQSPSELGSKRRYPVSPLPRGSNVAPFWLWPIFGLKIIVYYPKGITFELRGILSPVKGVLATAHLLRTSALLQAHSDES